MFLDLCLNSLRTHVNVPQPYLYAPQDLSMFPRTFQYSLGLISKLPRTYVCFLGHIYVLLRTFITVPLKQYPCSLVKGYMLLSNTPHSLREVYHFSECCLLECHHPQGMICTGVHHSLLQQPTSQCCFLECHHPLRVICTGAHHSLLKSSWNNTSEYQSHLWFCDMILFHNLMGTSHLLFD